MRMRGAANTAIAALFVLVSGVASARADEVAPIAASLLPSDLSPWGMFLAADKFVKGVMVVLALASVATWTATLAKTLELLIRSNGLAAQMRAVENAQRLEEAIVALRGGGGLESAALEAMAEIDASTHLNASGVKERIASRLERKEAQFGRRLARAIGVLATTGATAPFVGLFGTVWGVMNSFIGISRQHTTNLAVVAPGIAEALLATALGLAAAIPAVVFYNLLARAITACRARYGDGAAAILRLASRDLDRARAAQSPAMRSPSAAAE